MKTLHITLWIAAALLMMPAKAASVSGQILDEAQRPLYGARVDISALPAGGVAFAPFQASKLTGRDGAFTFSVPAGFYRFCASLRQSNLLNPCVWSRTPPTITVAQNQAAVLPPIVLARGHALTIQINDAAGLLAQEIAKRSANTVSVGFTAPNGMFHPIPAFQRNASLREHVMVAPHDTPLKITVVKSGFLIADASGKSVSAGAQDHNFDAIIAGERSPRVFTFNITGKAALP